MEELKYTQILDDLDIEKNILNYNILHNIGNIYYKISLKKESIEGEKEFLESAIFSYTKALNIKYDEETKQNLDFVLEKLKKLKEKEEELKEKEKEEEKKNKEKQENKQNSSSGSENKQENKQNSSSGSENKQENKQNSSSGSEVLSKELKEQIKEYEKELESLEKQNQNYFNKPYREKNNDFFSEFLEFDNEIKQEKKDW